MTPAQVMESYHQWAEVHQAVHGELSVQERETVFELVAFLATCAQVYEQEAACSACPPAGVPYTADLVES